MGTNGRLSGFLRRWRQARYEVKQAKEARRDEREAEELQMAKEGVNRFPHPPMGGI
jgi:hypothetical protein